MILIFILSFSLCVGVCESLCLSFFHLFHLVVGFFFRWINFFKARGKRAPLFNGFNIPGFTFTPISEPISVSRDIDDYNDWTGLVLRPPMKLDHPQELRAGKEGFLKRKLRCFFIRRKKRCHASRSNRWSMSLMCKIITITRISVKNRDSWGLPHSYWIRIT